MLPGVMSTRHKSAENNDFGSCVFYIHIGFFASIALVRETYSDIGLSSFLTLSVGLQLYSLIFLRWRVAEQRGVHGLSQKTLIMQCFVHAFRLMSTTWLRGYVPVDGTGDGLYQLLDVAALLMGLHLVCCCRVGPMAHTYQAEWDTVDIRWLLLACAVLAVLVHPDLNARPLFDITWTLALYIDSIAMFPQLWLMARLAGAAEAAKEGISSHYLFGITCSRAANFVFWYHAYPELAPEQQDVPNFPGYAVVAAHLVQFFLVADFLWHYFIRCGTELGGVFRAGMGGASARGATLTTDI